MEREEFLKSLSLGVIAICAGCTNNGSIPSPAPLNSKTPTPGNPGVGTPGNGAPALAANQTGINLTTQLLTVGSQLKTNGILVFRIATANTPASFVAVQSQCTHEGGNLSWNQGGAFIICALHSAEFNQSGKNTVGPDGRGSTGNLALYSTTVTSGNYLVITT